MRDKRIVGSNPTLSAMAVFRMNDEGVEAVPNPGFIRRTGGRKPADPARLSNFHLAILAIVGVAALSVVTASLRMTDRAIDRAVAQREAAARFFESELSVLRIMAVTSASPVPARLYLGMEDCFKAHAPMPFDSEDAEVARNILGMCAEMEVGRLYAQGGGAMASQGRAALKQIGLLK